MENKLNINNNENNIGNKDLTNIAENRQMQEVQAAMIMAKKFPRDEMDSCNRIRKACKRQSLAEQAEYSYPRGAKKVNGASIRLAEAITQYWGNIDYGTIEIARNNNKSDMMAYAIDLENNTRRTMIFSVPHIRETRTGTTNLKDSRDIYEMTANMGARRVRACILAVIPDDVVEDAIKECRKTLSESYTEPLSGRLKNMLAAFDDKFQVSKTMIETLFGYNLESLTEQDYIKMKSIYTSLKDGMSKREDWFKIVHNTKSSLSLNGTEMKGIKNDM